MSLLHCICIEMNNWNYKDVGWFVCLDTNIIAPLGVEGPPPTLHFWTVWVC